MTVSVELLKEQIQHVMILRRQTTIPILLETQVRLMEMGFPEGAATEPRNRTINMCIYTYGGGTLVALAFSRRRGTVLWLYVGRQNAVGCR